MEWKNTAGGDGEEWGNSVQQTKDGGYIIAGYRDDKGMCLIKTGPNGWWEITIFTFLICKFKSINRYGFLPVNLHDWWLVYHCILRNYWGIREIFFKNTAFSKVHMLNPFISISLSQSLQSLSSLSIRKHQKNRDLAKFNLQPRQW